MLRSLVYRLYPSKKQEVRPFSTFRLCSELYNILLTEHEETYELDGRSLSRYDLNNNITNIKRQDIHFNAVHSEVLQNQADRLSKAFSNFFRRCREKKDGKAVKVGYTRYKKLAHSITYPHEDNSSIMVVGNKLNVRKLGRMPIVLHRPIDGITASSWSRTYRSRTWCAIIR
jgi:putative transposase